MSFLTFEEHPRSKKVLKEKKLTCKDRTLNFELGSDQRIQGANVRGRTPRQIPAR